MPQFTEFSPERFRAQGQRIQFALDPEGTVSFNYAAYLALQEPEAVALLFDQTERIVALRKVNPEYPNALRVRREQARVPRYLIEGSQDFIKYYDISFQPQRAMHYPGHEYSSGVLGFSLNELQTPHLIATERALTSRWSHTTDGTRVPNLMRLTNVTMSHPGMIRLSQSRYSSVKVGVAIASSSIDQTFTTSTIRSRFLTLLRSRAILNFLKSVSSIDPRAQWTPYAGRGAEIHEAILATADKINADYPPIAGALLHLPEKVASDSRRNMHFATLLIEALIREPDGRPPEAAPLSIWYDRFRKAFTIPEAFRRNLTDAIHLQTFDHPPAEVGVWLNSPHSLLEVVDIQKFDIIPGSPASSSFMGFAVADARGVPARQIAADLLGQLCDYTLHLDGYESLLARLANSKG